jgi:hypothetical protein
MADIEETIEYMICAFIIIGIIVVAGWAVFTKMEISSHIGMTEDELKDVIPEDQYTDTLGLMKQQSAGFWIIAIIVAIGGLAALYVVITESM